jgi:hypothetical protein
MNFRRYYEICNLKHHYPSPWAHTSASNTFFNLQPANSQGTGTKRREERKGGKIPVRPEGEGEEEAKGIHL